MESFAANEWTVGLFSTMLKTWDVKSKNIRHRQINILRGRLTSTYAKLNWTLILESWSIRVKNHQTKVFLILLAKLNSKLSLFKDKDSDLQFQWVYEEQI